MLISRIEFNSCVGDTVYLEHIGYESKVNHIKVNKYYTIVSYIYLDNGVEVEHVLNHVNYNPKD